MASVKKRKKDLKREVRKASEKGRKGTKKKSFSIVKDFCWKLIAHSHSFVDEYKSHSHLLYSSSILQSQSELKTRKVLMTLTKCERDIISHASILCVVLTTNIRWGGGVTANECQDMCQTSLRCTIMFPRDTILCTNSRW